MGNEQAGPTPEEEGRLLGVLGGGCGAGPPGPACASGQGCVSELVHPTGWGDFQPAYSSIWGWGRSLGLIHSLVET